MKTINKFIFITILVVILPMLVHSQNNPIFELTPKYTNDSTLNQFIIHWLKKPYKLGGNTERGIDCSQFNKRLALDVYKISIENTCSTQWETTERIKKDSLTVGDLVFFKSKVSPSKWHCGTYIGETMFVHASNKYEGVKISSLDEPNYKKSYRGSGRTKK